MLLQNKSTTSAQELADRFEVSSRTIYRDISSLKTAGIPIIGDPGIGYSIVEGYKLQPVAFTEDETAALLTAEKLIGKMTDPKTKAHHTNAMIKIKSVLRNSTKQSAEILDESIALAQSDVYDQHGFLQIIYKSLTSKTKIELAYQKADNTISERIIDPIGCFHQGTNWYLAGYCHSKSDYRTFRLNRINTLVGTNEAIDINHLSLKVYMEKIDKEWKQDQSLKTIKVAFNRSLIHHAENRKYYFGFLEQVKDGDKTIMTFLNPSVEIMVRWLIQFGDQVTILSPPELKERMKELATDLFQHYTK